MVEELEGRVELILDGGPCPVGVESTVISLLGEQPVLLRPGGISGEQLAELLGEEVLQPDASTAITSPGMLSSHYAPNSRLRLNATHVSPEEALLAFGPKPLIGAKREINLSPEGDLQEAAARLFAALGLSPGITTTERPSLTKVARHDRLNEPQRLAERMVERSPEHRAGFNLCPVMVERTLPRVRGNHEVLRRFRGAACRKVEKPLH